VSRNEETSSQKAGYHPVDVDGIERRGRRMAMSRRLFFFGDGEFEGEATVLDISTNGCRATSLTEIKVGLSL
jgi:hypothetical protein